MIGCPPLMARTWTNDSGAVIDGELVASQEKEIILRLQDGRQVRIPRHVLSGADVEYIRQWESEEKGKCERMMSPSPQEDIHPDQEQAGVLIGDALAQEKWM
ncbi:MAG: SHD1 domain-containing protein, partial [Akkermansia sp.]